MFTAILIFLRPKSVLVATVTVALFGLAVISPLLFVLLGIIAFIYFCNKLVEAGLKALNVRHARALSAVLVTVGMFGLLILLPMIIRTP